MIAANEWKINFNCNAIKAKTTNSALNKHFVPDLQGWLERNKDRFDEAKMLNLVSLDNIDPLGSLSCSASKQY